jgi:ketosteroid isomerase-like protein
MSPNLDLVRSIYADWERGDFTSSVGSVHPDMELVVMDVPEEGPWKGLAAVADFWREWLGAWDSYRTEVDEYRELDHERVLVFGRMAGRGKATGASVETTFLNLVHVRDGKVVQLVMYPNRERGLADLGLKE